MAHTQNADEAYALAKKELIKIENEAGAYKTSLFEEKNHKTKNRLSIADKKIRQQYLEKKKIFEFWKNIYRLKYDLIDNFKRHKPTLSNPEMEEMQAEADILAQAIVKGIERLRKDYKIIGTPSIQNLLILAKLKKRGACKHWAEDILHIITSINRKYFMAYWGEAHPHKMTEHNVAVLVPLGSKFEDGLLIDPWRKAGKPFWILVKDDPHPFKQWMDYKPK